MTEAQRGELDRRLAAHLADQGVAEEIDSELTCMRACETTKSGVSPRVRVTPPLKRRRTSKKRMSGISRPVEAWAVSF